MDTTTFDDAEFVSALDQMVAELVITGTTSITSDKFAGRLRQILQSEYSMRLLLSSVIVREGAN